MDNKEQIKKFILNFKSCVFRSNLRFVLPTYMEELCIVQACVESGYGTCKIMMDNNAPFGIKALASDIEAGMYYETKTKEFINGSYVNIAAKFRKYDSLKEAADDWFALMMTKRYEPVRKAGSFEVAAVKVKECGYATGTGYSELLINVRNYIKDILEDLDLTQEPITNNYIVSTQKDPLNVRTAPDINAAILTSIPKDTKIYVSPWRYVPALGGFVHEDYIKEI